MPTVRLDLDSSTIYQEAESQPGRLWRTWLIGRPLATADAPHQAIGKAVGLAVFASDALSSTAHATQEIMVILAAAGTMAFSLVFPIAKAIGGLWRSSCSPTSRRSTRTPVAAALTSWRATIWASCPHKRPRPRCSPIIY